MVRRSDFRLTVWLVAYASLTVSSIVSGDSSVQFLCLIFLVSCPIFVDKCKDGAPSGGA